MTTSKAWLPQHLFSQNSEMVTSITRRFSPPNW